MGFNIRKTDKNVTIVDLSGELDRHTGLKDITGSFASMKFDKESRLVFNFKDVTYVCSEAVGLICSLSEDIRKAGGRSVCCALSGLPKDVFDLLGVPKILASFGTEAEALSSVISGSGESARRQASA